ncbi:hypothetical protein PanWU01x14_029420 [Parasponia andersonii]|uniref:Uncharacterized protein n=1 Tax=Parasponia andersonii TaxID=3476 RepID=A0A2P5DVJ3_PARAD|nr:hypothetical protein PanWU01x14_029420 [Parasponia andersonii]
MKLITMSLTTSSSCPANNNLESKSPPSLLPPPPPFSHLVSSRSFLLFLIISETESRISPSSSRSFFSDPTRNNRLTFQIKKTGAVPRLALISAALSKARTRLGTGRDTSRQHGS